MNTNGKKRNINNHSDTQNIRKAKKKSCEIFENKDLCCLKECVNIIHCDELFFSL
jgi:hypothetical protein